MVERRLRNKYGLCSVIDTKWCHTVVMPLGKALTTLTPLVDLVDRSKFAQYNIKYQKETKKATKTMRDNRNLHIGKLVHRSSSNEDSSPEFSRA